MSNAFTLKTIGEWDKEVGIPLSAAMKVTIETTKKTGEEAVSRCIVMMAQHTRQLTPQGKKRRPVFTIKDGLGPYVNVFSQKTGTDRQQKIHKFRFEAGAQAPLRGTWDDAQKIGNAGMAKRSWFWGLRGLPGAPYAMGGKPYPGVSKMITLRGRGDMAFGLILENRLNYITKIIPSDYEAQAVRSAGNRILTIAAQKIERDFQRDLQRSVRGVAGALFRAAA